MANTDRPAKDLRTRRSTATVTEGVGRGQAKDGRTMSALRRERTGRSKPTVKAATALYGRTTAASRTSDPQVEEVEDASEQSVRLRLQVRRDRITVLSSAVVDAPPPDEPVVRGTDFIEVRSGDRVIGLESLVDPGLSIAIPDRSDPPDEFRGHHIVAEETWELTIRVPVDAIRESAPKDLRIVIYSAPRHIEVDARNRRPLADRLRTVSESASSAPLQAADLPSEITDTGTGRKRSMHPRD